MTNCNSKTVQPINKRTQHLKMPVLAPLFTSILVLLATFTLAIYRLQQQHITNDVQMQLESTKRAFNQLLIADAQLLSATTDSIKNDPNIQAAWFAADRGSLFKYASPAFEKIRCDYRVTHLYFIDVNSTCFLRVHKPESFGDHIDRFTLASAAKTQKQAWGIELGPYGTFTLRVVQPWLVNNSLVGYVEVGEEIDHITPQLKNTLNIDLVVFIYKSLLNRADWEQNRKMTGRSGCWDEISDCVVADSTISFLPPEFVKYASCLHKEHNDRIFASTLGNSAYRAGFLPLFDASGREVGDILVIRNVSAEQASLQALLAVVATLCFLIASLLVSFFYVHIAGIEKRFLEANSSLITEIEKRKSVEAELCRHQNNLEDIINQRTAELQEANTQLQQQIAQRTKAEKALEKLNADLETTVARLIRSNRQLRDFAHLASHDLKTPLRGIGTLAQWLLTDYYDKFDDEGRKQIDLLVKRVETMDKIINAILEYSTIVRNKSSDRRIDTNTLVKNIVLQIQPPQNIKVTVNENLPSLICEEKHIHQVLFNLIENAVKFMDKPDGLVAIDCVEDQRFWKFSVSDNGPGIDHQYHDRIFQLFQTLADTDAVKNTGAGLSFVKKIVELYDGRVWLESAPGKGSAFFFTWPVSSYTVPHRAPQTQPSAS